jgi:DNA-binding CsgD family transcriptional regulator
LRQEVDSRTGCPNLDALARRYRLTPAEVKVIHSLIETGSLRRTAERLQRSRNTLRAQLRAIFDKTGARSQVALMALVHRR